MMLSACASQKGHAYYTDTNSDSDISMSAYSKMDTSHFLRKHVFQTDTIAYVDTNSILPFYNLARNQWLEELLSPTDEINPVFMQDSALLAEEESTVILKDTLISELAWLNDTYIKDSLPQDSIGTLIRSELPEETDSFKFAQSLDSMELIVDSAFSTRMEKTEDSLFSENQRNKEDLDEDHLPVRDDSDSTILSSTVIIKNDTIVHNNRVELTTTEIIKDTIIRTNTERIITETKTVERKDTIQRNSKGNVSVIPVIINTTPRKSVDEKNTSDTLSLIPLDSMAVQPRDTLAADSSFQVKGEEFVQSDEKKNEELMRQIQLLQTEVSEIKQLLQSREREPIEIIKRDTIIKTIEQTGISLQEERYIFYFASAHTNPINETQIINEIRAKIGKSTNYRIQLSGYTDASGSVQANLVISAKRTEQVRRKLVEAGIDERKIFSQYFGEQFATHQNADEDRKVECVVSFSEQK